MQALAANSHRKKGLKVAEDYFNYDGEQKRACPPAKLNDKWAI